MDLNICLNLPQFKALEVREEEGSIVIEGKLENTDKTCTECGKEHTAIHQYYRKQIRHLPMFGRPTYLLFKQANWRCKQCRNTYLEQVGFLENQRPYTKQYEDYVYELAKKQEISRVAELEGLSWDTAYRIFKKGSRKTQSRDRQDTGWGDLVH